MHREIEKTICPLIFSKGNRHNGSKIKIFWLRVVNKYRPKKKKKKETALGRESCPLTRSEPTPQEAMELRISSDEQLKERNGLFHSKTQYMCMTPRRQTLEMEIGTQSLYTGALWNNVVGRKRKGASFF